MSLIFIKSARGGLNCILLFLYILSSTNCLEAQISNGNTFSWPEDLREQARTEIFTRSKDRTLLEIPVPGNPVEFYINPNSFIKSVQSENEDVYRAFSGRDSIDRPVFGYYKDDHIHLSYYQNGQIITIGPADKEQDLYEITSTGEPEALGEVLCAAKEIQKFKVRNGGASVNCQSQNYSRLTFELFIVCTGEWGQHYGSKSAARAGIVNNVTALNALYTAELNISFNLTTDDDFLFTIPSEDEFDPDGIIGLAIQARNFFNGYVKTSYNIGHVMHYINSSSTRASGVAYLRSSCVDDYKGGGWTGTSKPGNTSFNIQIFGHEIGHQLGADHNFYGSEGNCTSSQRSSGNGFEPGSGSSMMSYEGQCGSHNLDGPRSSTNYFNTHSVSQILQRINNLSSCGYRSGNSSNLSVQIPRDFSIPKSTAFDLTGTGGNSAYSYIWEQYDTDNSSAGSSRGNPINGGKYNSTPMYRSYDPSGQGYHRSFPSKQVQASGSIKKGEVYATVGRDITMRLMTRSGGNIRCDEMTVTVRNATPFKIEKPLKNDLIALSKSPTRASEKMTVQWETGDTENNGFPNIDILYSTDGGTSYPYILADEVANDGEHEVRPPEIDTDKARLKILLSDGSGQMAIYHENRGNFTVGFSVTPIEIADFSGKLEDNHHSLSWVLNNTGEHIKAVNLQYSYDGINFNSIAMDDFEILNVESHWTGGYKSSYTDASKTYYRLAIENVQNKTTFSSVIALRNEGDDNQLFSIHPNPVSYQSARMEFQKYLKADARITLRSVNGQKMYEAYPALHTKSLSIPFPFPDGLYIVEVVNGNDIYKKKVIVQKR